jgi:DtxR family Mn-dependent transcriptional regulator
MVPVTFVTVIACVMCYAFYKACLIFMEFFVMVHHMSESIEMYLLRIALLQDNEQPVPIPRLAQELAVSPVSASEMCRKLTEMDFITYEPYKGVNLTTEGEALAQRVLRHRRLWEVFFVEKLGIEAQAAEEIACRFEHVTPEAVAKRLSEFLGHPAFSPQNQPIPAANISGSALAAQPLTTLAIGNQGQVINISADAATQEFLRHQGITPGVTIESLGVTGDGTLLLQIGGQRLLLSGSVAGGVYITSVVEAESSLVEAVE